MDEVYYLDLQTLLEYLHGKSATMSTPVKVSRIREPCMGSLVLKEGRVVDSLVQTQDGRVLYTGEQAYALLRGSEEWHVHMELNQEEATLNRVQTVSPGVLRQKQALEPFLHRGIPTKDRLVLRMVFTLVNGARTPEQIKAQLNLPPQAIEKALADLHNLGVIE